MALVARLMALVAVGIAAATPTYAQPPAPPEPKSPASGLAIFVATEPDPGGYHYDDWLQRDKAAAYLVTLLRRRGVQIVERPEQAELTIHVVKLTTVAATTGDQSQRHVEVLARVSGLRVTPKDLIGVSTVTYSAVVDLAHEFDKWIKDQVKRKTAP
jgi:hypothetical protein